MEDIKIVNEATFFYIKSGSFDISGSNSAVECQLPKLNVAGSIPVSRSNFWTLSSVGSERRPYKAEVAGSNPAASTNKRAITK